MKRSLLKMLIVLVVAFLITLIKYDIIDYKHTLAENSWQIETSPIHLINVFKCHEKR